MYMQVVGHKPDPGMVVGIDEAGKGCVVGDLVIGAVFWPDEKAPVAGLRDSKKLRSEKREMLFKELKARCPCVTISIHAHEIKPKNILDLQIAATRMILRKFRPRRAVIDCPHSTPAKFVRLLACPHVDILAEHKADDRYPITSAGSIVAKVVRDRKIRLISKLVDRDIGCGYPGDMKTRSWLEYLAEAPDEPAGRLIRWGWSTCKDIFGDARVARELNGR